MKKIILFFLILIISINSNAQTNKEEAVKIAESWIEYGVILPDQKEIIIQMIIIVLDEADATREDAIRRYKGEVLNLTQHVTYNGELALSYQKLYEKEKNKLFWWGFSAGVTWTGVIPAVSGSFIILF